MKNYPTLKTLHTVHSLQSFVKSNASILIYSTLLSSSIFLPSVIHQQGITGPIINAILILTTVWFGSSQAMMVGVLPSLVALSRGLLPLPLAPVVPFIMVANCFLVLTFDQLKSKSFFLAVVGAASVKFFFLYLVSQVLLANLLPGKFLTPASQMMSWPQLVTALTGGLIAWLVLKKMPKLI